MNQQIREFEKGLIAYINQSDIPIEVKRLIIKDVFYKVEKTANDVINQEIQLLEAQKEKETQNNIEVQNNEEEATE